ncbi:MAG: 1-acyl-sn-glycerol-3-phosphate acyltransferase [Clostridia bacterium]|nr:1-acyl-sn-glycerol-3-phosphate acyltransferase [Clostridia bacterium]
MAKSNKKKKWIKFRHRIVTEILRYTLGIYARFGYNIKIKKFREQGKRQFLVLLNHQTAYDQFFVGLAFRGPMYYVASEDLFSKGWVSSLIKYLIAPIPIKKQTTDVRAVLNCIKVAKEGGTIVIAPEGNRTYSGKTEYMSSSIVSLAKKLGLPIALYRLEGGYGVHPRWSDVIRRGKMTGYVAEVIEPEEYREMTDEELFSRIENGLYVNEAVADGEFKHKKLAEYLERAVYVCPKCGLSEFESNDDIISCKKCGLSVRYTPKKELVPVEGEFPFNFVNDWYDYQCDFMNSFDPTSHTDAPLYEEVGNFSEVIIYKEKRLIAENAKISLYGDRIVISGGAEDMTLDFDTASAVVVLGKNKLNIYFGEHLYQIKSSKRFNALKYVHMYYRYKNIKKGDGNGKFLGL